MFNIAKKLWSQRWVVADTHYCHPNIILHAGRTPWIVDNPNYDHALPYHFKHNNPKAGDVKAHDEALIENWNERVGRKDSIKILGDFAYKNHKKYILALNGSKELILGNHDEMNGDCYSLFDEVKTNPEIDELREECGKWLKNFNKMDRGELIDNILLSAWNKFVVLNDMDCIDQMTKECYTHLKGVYPMGQRCKMPIEESKEHRKAERKDVTFCHYAMRTWASSIHGAWNLFGHSHGRMLECEGMLSFDVGVDIWDYAPIPWEVVIEKMRRIQEGVERFVDGESDLANLPVFDKRVMENRRNNYNILASMGIPVKYPEMLESA